MKPIFEWEIPEDYKRVTKFDNVPKAYRIYENLEADSGIVVEARYNGIWHKNPSALRPLIKHLLGKLDKKKKNRPDIILREEDFKLFYKAYPKKRAPGQAEKTWNALERKKKLPDLETLLTAIRQHIIEKHDLQFHRRFCPEWPHPSTWLNARSWENEIIKIDPAGLDRKWSDPDDNDIPY